MNRKTIYIAGPMAGMPDCNCDAFEAAEKKLANEGWQVINPFDFTAVFACALKLEGAALEACMAAELAALPHLDAIYLLKGWNKSKGARRELLVALQHDLIVIEEGEDNA